MLSTRQFLPLSLLLLPLLGACAATDGEMSDANKLEYYGGNAERYLNMEEYERAQDQIQRGMEVDPTDPRLNLMLGLVLLKRGGTEDLLGAERVLRPLVQNEDFRAALWLAMVMERKGVLYEEGARDIASGDRLTEAADPLKRAEELRASSREFLNDSVDLYSQATEKFGEGRNHREILIGQTRVLALLGDQQGSLIVARDLLATIDVQVEYYRTSIDRVDISADEEARLRNALRAEEDLEAKMRLHTSQLATDMGQLSEAAADLTRLVELRPKMPEAHSLRGQVLAKLGRYDEAIYSLEKYLTLSPHDFTHPDIPRATNLVEECQRKIREALATAGK